MSANELTQVEVALPEVGASTTAAQEAIAAVQAEEHNRRKLIQEYPDWLKTLIEVDTQVGRHLLAKVAPSPDYGYSENAVFMKNTDASIKIKVAGAAQDRPVAYLSFYNPKRDNNHYF